MINHFNFMWRNGEVLVTNDFGDYAFLKKEEFLSLATNKVHKGSALYELLSARGFVTDDDPSVFISKRIDDIRSIKGYLFSATSLHIFAVTNQCNQNCVYCQASSRTEQSVHCTMSFDTMESAVKLMFRSPAPVLTMEFQGGEPSLEPKIIKYGIELAEEINKQ